MVIRWPYSAIGMFSTMVFWLYSSMKCWILALVLSISMVDVSGQVPDLSFENWPEQGTGPDWGMWGSGYLLETDTSEFVSGKKALKTSPSRGWDTTDYVNPYIVFPVEFTGKTIRLEGHIKLEKVENGFAGLMLRLDGPNGQIAFDNMSSQHLSGTSLWQNVAVELPYDESVKFLYVGVVHSGSGTAWFDDLKVYIDGKNIREIEPKEAVTYEALNDAEFIEESWIEFDSLSELQEKGIYKLCRVWGLMKYYHPAIAKGKYNWDFELFRFVPSYIAAQSEAEQNILLNDWVLKYGKLSPIKKQKNADEIVVMSPDFSWITPSFLGDDLSATLHQVIASDRPKKHFYFSFMPNVGNVVFEHEEPYYDNQVLDGGFRMLLLFRLWNQVEYFFPYKYAIGKDWGMVLKEYINPILITQREPELKPILLKLLAEINDTHVSLNGNFSSVSAFMGLRSAAVDTDIVEDKLVVVDYYNEVIAKAEGWEIGDVVEEINGKPAMEVVKERLPYISASNLATKYRSVNALRTNDSTLHLTILRNDKQIKLDVSTFGDGSLYFWNRYNNADSCFSMLNDSVAYIYAGNLTQDYVDEVMVQAIDAKAIIIDLRCYPGFFPLFKLGEYLMPTSTPFCITTNTSVEQPGKFVQSQVISIGSKNDNYYTGQVIILINEFTQSSAEFHAMAWRQAPNALVVGSQTAGADGNVSTIILPGGIQTMFSGIGIYYPDGSETQRVGIIPDVEVKRTIAGVKAGRDEILDKALSLVK